MEQLIQTIATGGAATVLAVVFYSFLKGFLVSGIAYEQMRIEKDARIAEVKADSETWKNLYMSSVGDLRASAKAVQQLANTATSVERSP